MDGFKVMLSDRAHQDLGNAIHHVINGVSRGKADIVFLCIGTDRSTGDALGPLVGEELGKGLPNVYGTLSRPVHATNLEETIKLIESKHRKPLIVAIDACLGRSESIGTIYVKKGSLTPGSGVAKKLPSVGDISISGVVNMGGFMEYFVLQTTRLGLVMKMARVISEAILAWAKEYRVEIKTPA